MKKISKTLRFPENILNEIQPIIHKNNMNFTSFVISAIQNYIKSLNYADAIHKSYASWNNKNHVELKKGVQQYIKKMRKGRSI